jgi:AGCS family alanine or glycine:cation symporter
MLSVLKTISSYVWGWPLIILLLGTGIYLTFLLRGLQFRTMFSSLYLALVKRKEDGTETGDISHFQALMTALAATVGTGNIAGVAIAIASGGPGAIFWMWVTGFFGMATKYSEAVLAVKYREVDENGNMIGGPMFYIEKGLKSKWLAVVFASFCAISALGIGNMVQANSVAEAMKATFNVNPWITAIVLGTVSAVVIMGGIKNIARATSVIVPVMIVFYMLAAIVIIVINYDKIGEAFSLIFYHAFNPMAAAGGFAGAMVQQTIRMGVARGIFSNESGLGSSPIAAAAAQTSDPVKQALVSMTQTFIDTIVVCTMTALAIITTGAWKLINPSTGKAFTGAALTEKAFTLGMPGEVGGAVVTLGLVFFAYSTILGWSYYGEKAVEYLFGLKLITPYRIIFIAVIFFGAVTKLEIAWAFSDIMNGLMAAPNLIALVGLSGVVAAETKRYFSQNSVK